MIEQCVKIMDYDIDDILGMKLTMQQWDSYLENLTAIEFHDIYSGLMNSLPEALNNYDFEWFLNLMCAMAKKMLEFACFFEELSDDERSGAESAATKLHEFIIALIPDGHEKRALIEAAWNDNVYFCNTYGYRSSIYSALNPRKIFRY